MSIRRTFSQVFSLNNGETVSTKARLPARQETTSTRLSPFLLGGGVVVILSSVLVFRLRSQGWNRSLVVSGVLGLAGVVSGVVEMILAQLEYEEMTERKRVYEDLDDIFEELEDVGLSDPPLMLGIDLSNHNVTAGKHSFSGRSLHSLARTETPFPNPYQLAIWTIGKVWPMSEALGGHSEDKRIRVLGFHDTDLLPCLPNDHPCIGFEEVLAGYTRLAAQTTLRGTANLAPLIGCAIEATMETQGFHILVVVGTARIGNRSMVEMTWHALVTASSYPLAIIMVGVGDGPWDVVEEFASDLRGRQFMNFHFVPFDERILNTKFPDLELAQAVLAPLPDMYRTITDLGLIEDLQISRINSTNSFGDLVVFDPNELLNEDDMIMILDS